MGCLICYEDWMLISGEDQNIVALPCGHAYHNNCIRTWFDSCPSRDQEEECPLCKRASNASEIIPLFMEIDSKEYRKARIEANDVIREDELSSKASCGHLACNDPECKAIHIPDDEEDENTCVDRDTTLKAQIVRAKHPNTIDRMPLAEQQKFLNVLVEFGASINRWVVAAHRMQLKEMDTEEGRAFSLVAQFGDPLGGSPAMQLWAAEIGRKAEEARAAREARGADDDEESDWDEDDIETSLEIYQEFEDMAAMYPEDLLLEKKHRASTHAILALRTAIDCLKRAVGHCGKMSSQLATEIGVVMSENNKVNRARREWKVFADKSMAFKKDLEVRAEKLKAKEEENEKLKATLESQRAELNRLITVERKRHQQMVKEAEELSREVNTIRRDSNSRITAAEYEVKKAKDDCEQKIRVMSGEIAEAHKDKKAAWSKNNILANQMREMKEKLDRRPSGFDTPLALMRFNSSNRRPAANSPTPSNLRRVSATSEAPSGSNAVAGPSRPGGNNVSRTSSSSSLSSSVSFSASLSSSTSSNASLSASASTSASLIISPEDIEREMEEANCPMPGMSLTSASAPRSLLLKSAVTKLGSATFANLGTNRSASSSTAGKRKRDAETGEAGAAAPASKKVASSSNSILATVVTTTETDANNQTSSLPGGVTVGKENTRPVSGSGYPRPRILPRRTAVDALNAGPLRPRPATVGSSRPPAAMNRPVSTSAVATPPAPSTLAPINDDYGMETRPRGTLDDDPARHSMLKALGYTRGKGRTVISPEGDVFQRGEVVLESDIREADRLKALEVKRRTRNLFR